MEKMYTELNTEPPPTPNIAELAADYAETYYKLTVVNINQKTADISAIASFSMIAALLVFFVTLFLGIAASLWLGGLMYNLPLGFVIVGIFCLLIFLILFLTRKKIFYPFIKNLVIKSIYE